MSNRSERPTTKVRIVFVASSKAQGCMALKDALYAGLNLNPDVRWRTLNFRSYEIADITDIEKAFL